MTGSRRNLIEKIWTTKGWLIFPLISTDETERFKPHPDPYLSALKQIKQPAKNCLVIENAPAGIQAANSAGITCFSISSTLPAEKLNEAFMVFPDLKYLSRFFERITP